VVGAFCTLSISLKHATGDLLGCRTSAKASGNISMRFAEKKLHNKTP
jgi:hypothetical protein